MRTQALFVSLFAFAQFCVAQQDLYFARIGLLGGTMQQASQPGDLNVPEVSATTTPAFSLEYEGSPRAAWGINLRYLNGVEGSDNSERFNEASLRLVWHWDGSLMYDRSFFSPYFLFGGGYGVSKLDIEEFTAKDDGPTLDGGIGFKLRFGDRISGDLRAEGIYVVNTTNFGNTFDLDPRVFLGIGLHYHFGMRRSSLRGAAMYVAPIHTVDPKELAVPDAPMKSEPPPPDIPPVMNFYVDQMVIHVDTLVMTTGQVMIKGDARMKMDTSKTDSTLATKKVIVKAVKIDSVKAPVDTIAPAPIVISDTLSATPDTIQVVAPGVRKAVKDSVAVNTVAKVDTTVTAIPDSIPAVPTRTLVKPVPQVQDTIQVPAKELVKDTLTTPKTPRSTPVVPAPPAKPDTVVIQRTDTVIKRVEVPVEVPVVVPVVVPVPKEEAKPQTKDEDQGSTKAVPQSTTTTVIVKQPPNKEARMRELIPVVVPVPAGTTAARTDSAKTTAPLDPIKEQQVARMYADVVAKCDSCAARLTRVDTLRKESAELKKRNSLDPRIAKINTEVETLTWELGVLNDSIQALNRRIDKVSGVDRKSDWRALRTAMELQYALNQAALTSAQRVEIKEFAGYLKREPAYRVMISGYTDRSGDAKYNMMLSRRRASIVEQALIAEGVPRERLLTRYFGEKFSSTQWNRNERRTELQLLVDTNALQLPAKP